MFDRRKFITRLAALLPAGLAARFGWAQSQWIGIATVPDVVQQGTVEGFVLPDREQIYPQLLAPHNQWELVYKPGRTTEDEFVCKDEAGHPIRIRLKLSILEESFEGSSVRLYVGFGEASQGIPVRVFHLDRHPDEVDAAEQLLKRLLVRAGTDDWLRHNSTRLTECLVFCLQKYRVHAVCGVAGNIRSHGARSGR